jgi:octopine/nopaline transport system ATP-binding protein
MLVVTHEIGFAREVANRVVFLHEGVIEEDGPAEMVFNNSKSERFRSFIANTRHA